jgi:outer membrane protein TolC
MTRTHVGFPVLVALAVALAAPAYAQTPVTLEAAVAAAVANNPAVAAARAGAEGGGAGVTAARGAWFPRVTLAESAQRGDQPVFAFGALLAARQFTAADFAVSRLNQPDATNLFTTRLSVGQLIFDGGRTPAAVAAAGARQTIAEADVVMAELDVAVAVADAFGQMVQLQASVDARNAAVAAAREDLQRAERRRDAGMATDADVLAVSVHLADLEQQQLQLGADLASASAQLNRLMGTPVTAPLVATTSAPETGIDVPNRVTPTELETLFAEAESARPEVRRAQASIRLADAGVRTASSLWLPQVSAQAGLEWNGLAFGTRSRAWVVGAEARWSLSLSGADRARVRAATAARTAAERVIDDVRASVRVEVLTAIHQLNAARGQVDVGRAAVAQAAERARVVRNRYDAGLASMTDVLAAASAELDAQARRVAATVAVLRADAALQRALGRPVAKRIGQ